MSFLFSAPPSCKHFDPWYFKCLISLLGSWAPSSSLATFKLAWKMATLIAPIVTGTLFWFNCVFLIYNQYLYLQHWTFLFPHLAIRWINWVTFYLKVISVPIPKLLFALYFIWKVNYSVPSLLGRKQVVLRFHVWFGLAIGSTVLLKQCLPG